MVDFLTAMTGTNVDDAFISLIKTIYDKAVLQHVYKPTNGGAAVPSVQPGKTPFALTQQTNKGKKKDCCPN